TSGQFRAAHLESRVAAVRHGIARRQPGSVRLHDPDEQTRQSGNRRTDRRHWLWWSISPRAWSTTTAGHPTNGRCPLSRRCRLPWLTAVDTMSCLVVIDAVSPWEPANPHCQGSRHVVDTGRPNALGIVSTKAAPSGGKNAAAGIISRAPTGPSLVTTPGTVNPANEWPTMTRSS